MQDLITGAVILGCGGGGDPAMAQAMVDEVFDQRKGIFPFGSKGTWSQKIGCAFWAMWVEGLTPKKGRW